MRPVKILALGGDGIGPEVVDCGLTLVEAVLSQTGLHAQVSEDLLHGAAWDKYGTFCRVEKGSTPQDRGLI